MDPSSSAELIDVSPSSDIFLQDTLAGLRQHPKRLPSKYLYDERGSILFERICELEEYYPTRTELAIMEEHAGDMADAMGPAMRLLEYGSGASVKTRLLLDALHDPVACVLVDISGDHLQPIAESLAAAHPEIEVLPVCADFTQPFDIPRPSRDFERTVVYVPGSTIGNLVPAQAERLLVQMARQSGPGGGLLIGIDLQKDVRILEAAYNDREGVTAAFNLNLLARINRELSANFALEDFTHRAIYNHDEHRIEMHLFSQCDQAVQLAGETFSFAKGESICTEYSHKHTVEGFAKMAEQAGFVHSRTWQDANRYFSVMLFRCAAGESTGSVNACQ